MRWRYNRERCEAADVECSDGPDASPAEEHDEQAQLRLDEHAWRARRAGARELGEADRDEDEHGRVCSDQLV